MGKINCEVFFGNKDVGEMESAQLDVRTGVVLLDSICVNYLTAPKKWIEFTYEGQQFKLDACIKEGKIKVKKSALSSICLHMNLESSLTDTHKVPKKMKI